MLQHAKVSLKEARKDKHGDMEIDVVQAQMTQMHSNAPGGTHSKGGFGPTWKALSGQLFNHLLRADWLTETAFVERVARGAGSQTSMVSAISAITTLANTKSSS